MADTKAPIVPAGSQLSTNTAPQVGGANPANDPFDTDWLNSSSDPLNPQKPLDADPLSPGIDVFGSNISDLPSDITLPNQLATPIAPEPIAITQPEVLAQSDQITNPADLLNMTAPNSQPGVPSIWDVADAANTGVVVDPSTLAVAATIENPDQKALNKLVDQVASPKLRKNINTGIIFFLLLLVVLLSTMSLFLLLNGPVSVTINPGNSGNLNNNSTQPSSDGAISSATSQGTITSSAPMETDAILPDPDGTPTDIYTYMLVLTQGQTIDPKSLPQGSISFQENYLVKVLLAEDFATKNPIQAALGKLFEIKEAEYGSEKYRNFLASQNLNVVVDVAEGQPAIVNLQGQVTLTNQQEILFAAQQIERTIENYTLNYKVMLNGSEQDYRCKVSPETCK